MPSPCSIMMINLVVATTVIVLLPPYNFDNNEGHTINAGGSDSVHGARNRTGKPTRESGE